MSVTLFIQYLSYFSAFVPLITVLIYWYRKKFSFDSRANLIGIYVVLYFITQFILLILAVNGIHNLFLLRIYTPIEVFIFSFFILSLQINSKKINLLLSLALCLIIILIDVLWGDKSSMPVESLMVEAITITLLGMSAIPSIKIKKDYESSFFYFTFSILFNSVNTLLGVGFIDLAPELSYNIQAIVAITSHLILAWGFYIIIKSNSETTESKTKGQPQF